MALESVQVVQADPLTQRRLGGGETGTFEKSQEKSLDHVREAAHNLSEADSVRNSCRTRKTINFQNLVKKRLTIFGGSI